MSDFTTANSETATTYHGSCECGSIQFTAQGPLRSVNTCHCTQCRKSSGHFGAFIRIETEKLDVTPSDDLTWFSSTDRAKKAFCKQCGSSLFWVLEGRDNWSVMAGAFDDDIPVTLEAHLFTSEKPTYYTLKDGLPQAEHFDIQTSQQPD